MVAAVEAMVEFEVFADAPPFKTTHGALTFAFNFSHGGVKRPYLATLADKPAPPGRGLSGLDGAGQAGMIRAEVLQLSDVRRRILLLRFAPPQSPCQCRAPCCTGFRPNLEWREAHGWVAAHVLGAALVGTVSNFRLRQALVSRYFGQEKSMVKISEECQVKRDTASEHNKRVVAYLEEEERRAEWEIQGWLEARGVVVAA